MLWYGRDRDGWLFTMSDKEVREMYEKRTVKPGDRDETFEEWLATMQRLRLINPTRKG